MAGFERSRSELVGRRSDLERRIEGIRADLQRHAEGIEPPPEVLEFMESMQREVGLIDCSIRRIDSREYDCCMQCGGKIDAHRLVQLPYTVNCERCSRDYPADYIHQLRGQHSNLRRLSMSVLHSIGVLVDLCETGGNARRHHSSALVLLGDLARELPEHFALEEKNGMLEEALAVAPRYRRRARALMEEHVFLSRRLASIFETAESAGDDTEAWSDVLSQFQQLTLDLFAHEEAENDIAGSAFLDDIGSAD